MKDISLSTSMLLVICFFAFPFASVASTQPNIQPRLPPVVKEHIDLLNNPRLLKDVQDGRVTHDEFLDLQNAMKFLKLEPIPCPTIDENTLSRCMQIERPIEMPTEPIVHARLSAVTLLHSMHGSIQMTVVSSGKNRLHYSTQQMINIERGDVSADVTELLLKMQQSAVAVEYPLTIILSMDSALELETVDTPIAPGSAVVLEMYTTGTQQLEQTYLTNNMEKSIQRSKRSLSSCSEAFGTVSDNTVCCLEQKLLSRSDAKVRSLFRYFILPDEIPLSRCSGGCPGSNSCDAMEPENEFLNRLYLGANVTMPAAHRCCKPTSTASLTLVRLDSATFEFVFQRLDHGVILGCSCT